MDKKYVVPEGGLKAALGQVDYARAHSGVEEGIIKRALQDFVRWLSENPIVPTMEQATEMSDSGHPCVLDGVWYATEWQRRMFLAPETPDEREMIVYECHNCKKSWKQQFARKGYILRLLPEYKH